MRRFVLSALLLLTLAACATGSRTADLRPAFAEAAATEVARLLDCRGVSDIVCQCRREGLEMRLPSPGPGQLDEGYAILVAAIVEGATAEEATAIAVTKVADGINADIKDVCTWYDSQP